MQTHIYYSSKKNKEKNDYKLEANLSQKELKMNRSFSYSNNIIDKIKKKELILYIKHKNEKKNLSNNNDYSYDKEKNLRKNFLLKSEIFNQNPNIGIENVSSFNNYKKQIININEKLPESKHDQIKENFENSKLISNYFDINKNNIFDYSQYNSNNLMINNNNLLINSRNNYNVNNINNYPILNYPSSLNQNYSYINQNFNNFYKYSNNKIITHINNNYVNLAKTQSGSKFLQEKILLDNEFANDILYQSIKNNLKEICNNIYGASLMKALFKQLRYENLNSFLTLINTDIYDICLTESGSYAIQSLIESIHKHPLLLNKFIYYLNNRDIMKIFLSPYGNHTIKCFLSIVKELEFTNFIFNYVYKNFTNIAKEKYGVCIIQKCFSVGDEKEKKQIINLIIENLEYIIKDNYGNYLIQYIFSKNIVPNFELILPLIKKIEEKIIDYCKYKYSASVLEKCFEKGDEKISEHFMNYLLEKHSNDIIYITANQFGFYVIKKSFYIKNVVFRKKLFNIIKKDINKLNRESKERKLIYSLLKEFSEFCS